jgi:hypothetical protein
MSPSMLRSDAMAESGRPPPMCDAALVEPGFPDAYAGVMMFELGVTRGFLRGERVMPELPAPLRAPWVALSFGDGVY